MTVLRWKESDVREWDTAHRYAVASIFSNAVIALACVPVAIKISPWFIIGTALFGWLSWGAAHIADTIGIKLLGELYQDDPEVVTVEIQDKAVADVGEVGR